MSGRHVLETTYCFDGSNDVELVITYHFVQGYPETGPTYDCGGDPAQPAECDVISVMVDGRDATPTEFDQVVTNDSLWQSMVDNVEGE